MAANTRNINEYHDAVLIGRGGFGAVYRATDPDHGRDVAIKVLDAGIDESTRRRFDRERQTMGRLSSHPNIVPVYESGFTAEGEPFIVMELAEAGSLRDRLNSGGPMPWPEAVEIIAAIATAAQAAHDYGVLHRDIKPDNILIDHFGNPKLTDFGIATVAGNITSTSNTTATLAHAAPEVFDGRPPTPAIDIYALGSTLVALITGRPPFLQDSDDTVTAMIARILTQPPPDLRPLGVPDGTARVVEKSLAKDPTLRQASPAHLASELRDGATIGAPSSAPYVPMPTGQATQLAQGTVDPRAAGPMDPLPTGQAGFSTHVTARRQRGWAQVRLAIGTVLAIGVLAGLLYLIAGPNRDTPTDATGTTIAMAQPGSDDNISAVTGDSEAGPGPAGPGPAVEIICPVEMPLNVETTCSITSANATSGQWRLPGFLPEPEPITTVPGDHAIFVQPTDQAAIGRMFVITATVADDSGNEATAELRFEVVGRP